MRFLCSGASQWSFQSWGHLGVVRMRRARSVMGKASVEAQFLSMVPGSRSGPVAFVVSIALRSRSVQRVRRRVKVAMVGVVSFG